MPIYGLGLSLSIAVFFAIHSIRTEQDRHWLFILFAFPFLGSVVYFFAIYLPSMRYTHSGMQFESKLRNILDPNKELRDAQYAFDLSPTVDAHLRLANALVNKGRAKEALPHYQSALSGVYKDTPDILLEYAYALFAAEKPWEAKQTLDTLREKNPNYRSDDGHLLYARTLVALNDKHAAKEEFNALVNYHPSLEIYVRYAEALIRWDEKEAAREQLDALNQRVKFLPKYAKQLNSTWINEAKELMKKL